MKRIVFWMAAVLALVTTACNNNTYNSLRQQEDKLIDNFVSRNGLTILTEEPAVDHVWDEKEYYKVPGYDKLYFHLIERGDSIRVEGEDTVDLKILANDLIVVRYKKFGLMEYADTLSYWTTLDQAYPVEFHYYNTSECEAVAWHEAVRLMKYPDSQCEIITPSTQGFEADQTSVTPYVYIMKIKVKQ